MCQCNPLLKIQKDSFYNGWLSTKSWLNSSECKANFIHYCNANSTLWNLCVKYQDNFHNFLSTALFPWRRKNSSLAETKPERQSHTTRMQEITCEWTILVFEPSPFIPSAFVLLLPFMIPLIRCTSVLLPGPPRALPFVCQLVAAPSAPSLHTFPSLPFPSSDFFPSFIFCAYWTFQVELNFQNYVCCSCCYWWW